MQDEVFPLNLALKCGVILNLCVKRQTGHTKPARSEPDHAEPHQGLLHKIVWYLRSSESLHSVEG
jgi:hypothetical protein